MSNQGLQSDNSPCQGTLISGQAAFWCSASLETQCIQQHKGRAAAWNGKHSSLSQTWENPLFNTVLFSCNQGRWWNVSSSLGIMASLHTQGEFILMANKPQNRMVLITRKYWLTLARDDNRNPLATSFPAFSFRWLPMAKMYSKTATNFGLDCSCLLAWIFWIISWKMQTFPQTDWKRGKSLLSVPSVPTLTVPTRSHSPAQRFLPVQIPQGFSASSNSPRQSCVGTVTPEGVTSFVAAKTTSASPAQKVFYCLVTQISEIRGSRAWSSILHLPPFYLHQLNSFIKIPSTVSPQGRIIISCTQTQ